MGSWGAGLFSNDDACDVRDGYLERLHFMEPRAAEAEILAEYGGDLPDCGLIALAVTQWRLGHLSPGVKAAAQAAIRRELQLSGTEWKPGLAARRRAVLERAAEQLERDMPPSKKPPRPSWVWKCPWSPGDVLQYRIRFPEAGYEHWRGVYVLLPVVAVSTTPEGRLPCEHLLVGLCRWYGTSPPGADVLERLSAEDLSVFTYLGGRTARTMPVLFHKNDIQEAELRPVCRLAPALLRAYYGEEAEIPPPSNGLLERGIYLTLSPPGLAAPPGR